MQALMLQKRISRFPVRISLHQCPLDHGALYVRSRCCCPTPQPREHSLHSDHKFQLQFLLQFPPEHSTTSVHWGRLQGRSWTVSPLQFMRWQERVRFFRLGNTESEQFLEQRVHAVQGENPSASGTPSLASIVGTGTSHSAG